MAEQDQDKDSKTEQPTSKRLGDAARKGDVARSMELSHWSALVSATVALAFIVPWMMGRIGRLSVTFIEDAHSIPTDFEHIRLLLVHVASDLGITLAPIALLFLVASLATTIAQVGWSFSFERLELKLSMMSPMKGLKRLFGVRALVEFVKGLAKLSVIGAVFFVVLIPFVMDIAIMPMFSMGAMLSRVHEIAYIFVFTSAGAMTILAALDFAYQKYEHSKNLMMTKQEIKDETKQSEGDPMVKRRIAELRMQRAQARMITAVAKADVVITNPTHYAVALKYDMDSMAAPKLLGKGVDDIAKRIREVADENNIPIVENPPLARAIYASVELDQEIPPQYYHAVAEVISYVFRLNGRLARKPGERLVPPKPDWSLDPERGDDGAEDARPH